MKLIQSSLKKETAMIQTPHHKILKIAIIFISAILIIIGLAGFMQYRQATQDKAASLEIEQAQLYSYYVYASGRKMHFVATKKPNQAQYPLVIFVHGAPGNWQNFKRYLTDPALREIATLVSIDRLGYGKSEKGKWEPSLKIQASTLHEIVKLYPDSVPKIFVGHSFGGPVLARYGIDYPDEAHQFIILAGSVDPELEVTKWYQTLANWFRFIVPSDWNVANQEILPLKGELEAMLPFWQNIQAKLLVIQGRDDKLVPHENARFIKQQIADAEIIYLAGQGHFLPWERYEMIANIIIKKTTANR